jgi:hypothetical protein
MRAYRAGAIDVFSRRTVTGDLRSVADSPRREVDVASDTMQVVVGDGVGGLVAELALRTIGGSIGRMFPNRQLEACMFDGHAVVPRNE